MILKQIYKTITLILVVFIFHNLQAETKDQRIKVELRTISHEFLLQLNDSTSRILPIEKIGGRYVVKFENEFAFEPDLLLFSVFKIYKEKNIQENFIVEVENCETKDLVHSFQVSQIEDMAMTPCRMRGIPKACYVFYFTEVENMVLLPENYIAENDDVPMTSKSSTTTYIYSFIFLLLASAGYYYYKTKETESEEVLPSDIYQISEYQFDKKAMTLTFNDKPTELSIKETDLLALLYSNENKTLEREYILNKVWEDEGSYVGRTLDVYISKLRKKLEQDGQVKIINVRGVGYRFVIHKI